MNGDGSRNRVKAQSADTRNVTENCFAVTDAGGVLLADRHEYEEDSHGRLWTTVWTDVPPNTVILRITIFRESGGYWEPLELPPTQTDQQVAAVEKLLRLHGLSLLRGSKGMNSG